MSSLTTARGDNEITGVMVIDPYNDFISEGGKVWDRIKGVAEANQCIPHTIQIFNAARRRALASSMRCIGNIVPAITRPGYIAPIQRSAWRSQALAYGTWGGEIRSEFAPQPGDIVAHEHWGSSGFANTDLDLQLKKQGIQKLIVMGLIAHTCVEATIRGGRT